MAFTLSASAMRSSRVAKFCCGCGMEGAAGWASADGAESGVGSFSLGIVTGKLFKL